MLNKDYLGTLDDFLDEYSKSVSDEELIESILLLKMSRAIREERKMRKQSQKEFAEYLNVTQANVSKWESGKYNFSIKSLAKICCSLDLEIDCEIRRKSYDLEQQCELLTIQEKVWETSETENVDPTYVSMLLAG